MNLTKIGDFLKRSKIPVDILDDNHYNRVTIRINHNGVSLRDNEIGKKIGTKKQFILKSGQFILSKIDARYGAFGIAPDEVEGSIITGNFWAYDVDKKKVNIEWFNQFTNSPVFYEVCERASSGITHRKYLDEKFFLNYEILLPSVEEQLIQIEKIKNQKLSFNKLTTELSHQLTLVKKLRQQFLQEAVQGMLVPQNPNDEPANELLKKIKAEKQKLIASKVFKQGKLQEAEKQEEIIFNIPQKWVWCNLDEICRNITDGTHQTPTYTNDGIPFISAQHVKPFKFTPDNRKYVSNEAYLECIKNKKPEIGDILITRVGAIGEAAVIDQSIDFAFYVSLGLIQPILNLVNSRYIELVINSPYGIAYSKGNVSSKGSSAGNYNLGRIRSFLIPLPPLNEQHRIVQKLDELMQTCDALEVSIKESASQNEKLLQQVLREALRKS